MNTNANTLNLVADLADLLTQIVDIESVSGNEAPLADAVEAALRECAHLKVQRLGNCVVARTDQGRAERVVIAGHLDTVPLADNLPSKRIVLDGQDVLWGRGTCDMKGGVAVQLAAAKALATPSRDVSWIFYDNEEVDADKNGLGILGREHPELLTADFAVLCEPSNAGIEGGCQGTMRIAIELTGLAAHSARAWLGHNAIHDAADVLDRLSRYEPRIVDVDGLEYHEGLNAVKIVGGIAGNVIPDTCRIEINFRFAPDRSLAQAEEFLAEFFDGYTFEVTDRSAGARPGLDQPAAASFLAAVGGQANPKFGWTDVARFAELGIPAVNYGPANPGKAHADDEFCPVADLDTCYAGLLRWLGAGREAVAATAKTRG